MIAAAGGRQSVNPSIFEKCHKPLCNPFRRAQFRAYGAVPNANVGLFKAVKETPDPRQVERRTPPGACGNASPRSESDGWRPAHGTSGRHGVGGRWSCPLSSDLGEIRRLCRAGQRAGAKSGAEPAQGDQETDLSRGQPHAWAARVCGINHQSHTASRECGCELPWRRNSRAVMRRLRRAFSAPGPQGASHPVAGQPDLNRGVHF